jgi:predicted nucleotidyltransferase
MSETEELSPAEWRRYKEKDGNKRTPLSAEVQAEELGRIMKVINEVIEDLEQESQDDYGQPFEIRALVIYGSWAQGQAAKKSDVDFITISVGEPASLHEEVASRIKEKTGWMAENRSEMNIAISDTDALKELLAGKNEVVGRDYIIVTPHSEVTQMLDQFRSSVA